MFFYFYFDTNALYRVNEAKELKMLPTRKKIMSHRSTPMATDKGNCREVRLAVNG